MRLQDQASPEPLLDTAKGYTVSGQGPAVVLLHSSMSSKEQWKPLIPLLRHRFKTISIDLTGYGDNDLPLTPQPFSTADEITLIEGILAKEIGSDEPFHLVGHSYGGAIALKLAVNLLGRIKTLTLFEPVAFHLLPKDGIAYAEITTIAQNMALALGKKDRILATALFINYWSGKGTFENLSQKNQALFVRYIDKVALDFHALFNESLTLKSYCKINIPVCMIKGEKSPLTSIQIFEILEHYLPDRCIHCVPGGHMSPITHFNRVNRIIEGFLIDHELK